MKSINIAWMYPDILNLHGDRGNLMAMKRVAGLMDIEANITRVENYEQAIDFENADMLFFNVGEIKVVGDIVKRLNMQAEELKAYVESGKVIVLIGTSGAVFANKLTRTDGTVTEGLGYLDMDCNEVQKIYGDDIHFRLEHYTDDEINGSQIALIETKLLSAEPLGRLIYGRGNNISDATEGAVYKNVVYTNALGPVFVKNPWFAEALIKTAMENKGIKDTEYRSGLAYDLERKSAECIKKFISDKQS